MLIYDEAHIDSLSLSIPFDDCEIINSNFTSRVLTYYYDTEEFDEELQNAKPYVVSYNGITIRFRIAERLNGTSTTSKFIILTVSSKMLKSRYFQGITIWNTEFIYREILRLNVIKLTYESFLNSRVSDVDICTNYQISEYGFLQSNKKIMSLSQPGKDRFFNFFQKKNKLGQYINLGLDINSRDKAKPSNPYLKNYFKTVELTTKSLEFYDIYLRKSLNNQRVSIKNLGRIEYTIKGYKHKQYLIKKGLLNENYNTLRELLQVPKNQLKKIIYSGFNNYCDIPDERNLHFKDTTDLSPTDALILNYMEQLLISGRSKFDLYDVLQDYDGTKKSRLKQKIDKLYKYLQTNNESLISKTKENEEIRAFIRKIQSNN